MLHSRIVCSSLALGVALLALAGCPLVEPAKVPVPDVVGRLEAAARTAIANAGLAVGSVSRAYSDTVSEDVVVSQSPAAGVTVAPDSAVSLVVSKGPETVAVPGIVGLAHAAAGTAIVNAGLSAGTVTQAYSATVPEGNVISQAPASGESVAPDSAVDFVVSIGPAPVMVPNVVGLTQSAAQTEIAAAGLTLGTVSQAYSGTVPLGMVISQDPAEGTSVDAGSAVLLEVSSGPEPVAVPDVVGLTQSAAESAVTSAGLSVGTVTDEYSDTVAIGLVISQDPAEGAIVDAGTAVLLEVSSGPEPVDVPGVVGLTQSAAESAITGAGLSADTVTEAYSDTVAIGLVISQDPAEGAIADAGTAVLLVVSSGPEPVDVPGVVGLTQSAAESAITGAGLSADTVTETYSDTVAIGLVISQDPAEGTSVAPGSAVDLVVSNGPAPVDVPGVVGLTQSAAESAIAGAGLSVGTVTDEYSDTVAISLVMSQDPAEGVSVASGSAVDLAISKGPEPVAVPDIMGLTQAAAAEAIGAATLSVGTVTQAHSATIEEGSVMSQTPAAGESVAPGSAVDFVVSKGPGPVTVPNLVGWMQSAAETEIVAVGLTLGTVSQAHSDTVPLGTVISQDPAEGAIVDAGTALLLVVSSGPAPVDVPGVIGLTQPVAGSVITIAGLTVGTVTHGHSSTVPEGRVISQDPAEGASVPRGSAVDLVVSIGPERVEAPDVVGLTEADAAEAIANAGLIVGAVSEVYSTTVAPGIVIGQDPVADEDAPMGSAVDLVVSLGPDLGSVLINEFVSSNDGGLLDEDGDAEDWIELYNPSDVAQSLDGWSLTDNADLPAKWIFPDVTMEAGSFLIVFASGKDRTGGDNLHTCFKLSSAGEYLALFKDGDAAVPASEFPPAYPRQFTDYAYGRYGGGAGFWYFDVPTPGLENSVLGNVYSGFVDGFGVSPARGFYETAFSVTLSTTTPDTTIRYTLDGTEPTAAHGAVYEEPLQVTANAVVRARGFAPNFIPSALDTHTYLFGVPAAQQARPVISIAADSEESLFEPNGIMAIVGGTYVYGGPFYADGQEFQTDDVWEPVNQGDYNNPMQRGIEYERPTSVELIYPEDNTGFQVDCGIRVQGSGFHRRRYRRDPGADWTEPGQNALGVSLASYNKFSFRLFFRGEYGPARLEYPLFPQGEIERFDRLVCRGGHNDGYNPFIHDELVRRLGIDTGQLQARGIIANLFINGEFKGYYNVTERLDQEFFQDWYDSGEDWDVLTPDSVREGDNIAWYTLISLAYDHPLADPYNYFIVSQRMDLVNFVDYLLVQLYVGNEDWPDNNWVVARERSEAGRFTFYLWDSEASFRPGNINKTGIDNFPFGRPEPGQGLKGEDCELAYLYRALVENADFRALFSERAHLHLAPGGALSKENVRAHYEALRQEMLPMRPDFQTYIGDLWIPDREDVLIDVLRAEGLYVD